LAEARICVVNPTVDAHAYRNGTQLSAKAAAEHARVLDKRRVRQAELLGKPTRDLQQPQDFCSASLASPEFEAFTRRILVQSQDEPTFISDEIVWRGRSV